MHARLSLPLLAVVAVAAVAFGARPLQAAADCGHHGVKTSRLHACGRSEHDAAEGAERLIRQPRGARATERQLRVRDDADQSTVPVAIHVERLTASAAPATLRVTPQLRDRQPVRVAAASQAAGTPAHFAPSPSHPAAAVPPQPAPSPPPPIVGAGAGLVAPAVLPAVAGSQLPLSLSIATAVALVLCAALAAFVLRRVRGIG